MKMSNYLSRMGAKNAEVRLLKFILIGIAGCTVLNTYILHRAMATRHTVLVPAGGITEELSISYNHADKKYLHVLVNYVMNLMGNYTPLTARQQFEKLLTLYDPRYYPQALASFLEIAEDVEYSHASSSLGITQMIFKGDAKVVEVKGTRRQYIDDKMVDNREVTYEVHYLVRDGRFFLKGISEKKKAT